MAYRFGRMLELIPAASGTAGSYSRWLCAAVQKNLVRLSGGRHHRRDIGLRCHTPSLGRVRLSSYIRSHSSRIGRNDRSPPT